MRPSQFLSWIMSYHNSRLCKFALLIAACGLSCTNKPKYVNQEVFNRLARLEAPSIDAKGELSSPLPTQDDFSGLWHQIKDKKSKNHSMEPSACNLEMKSWLAIEQKDSRVSLYFLHSSASRGDLPSKQVSQYERGIGSRRQNTLSVDAEEVITVWDRETGKQVSQTIKTIPWRLSFDQETGQLIGERNGKIMRLAPLYHKYVPAQNKAAKPCPPPP
ncbi:MAG: hypothetical protein HRU19_01340 [Pseudobacteriovorax sp.]|nr:hypothetical protein [Pseudobacteriovorax sp.]